MQSCGKHCSTNFQFFFPSPNRRHQINTKMWVGTQSKPDNLDWPRNDSRNAELHFHRTSSVSSTTSWFKLFCFVDEKEMDQNYKAILVALKFSRKRRETKKMVYKVDLSWPTSGGYPVKCPSSRMSYSQCCHDDGESSCCFYDGNRCHSNTTINAKRDYCPRPQDDQSMKICCVSDGEASCCISGGNGCRGDVTFRDYCPGSDEDSQKDTCCSFRGNETCCLSGGNFCYDSGAGTRSYCPSPEHSREETLCCLQKGKPSCCKPHPPPP